MSNSVTLTNKCYIDSKYLRGERILLCLAGERVLMCLAGERVLLCLAGEIRHDRYV